MSTSPGGFRARDDGGRYCASGGAQRQEAAGPTVDPTASERYGEAYFAGGSRTLSILIAAWSMQDCRLHSSKARSIFLIRSSTFVGSCSLEANSHSVRQSLEPTLFFMVPPGTAWSDLH